MGARGDEQPTSRSESKYFNTAARMDDAIMALLEEKSLEFVTVKEICERAGVNRSTFYLHYTTIEDLLGEAFARANEEFYSYFGEGRTLEEEGPMFLVTPEYLLPHLSFVRDHQRLFAAALSRPASLRSQLQFEDIVKPVIDRAMDHFGVPARERDYMAEFYMKGIVAIVTLWVARGCPDSPESVAHMIVDCVKRP